MGRPRLRVPRVPKPKRRTGKRGQEVGNYYIRSHGAEINLATRDPDEAIRRSTEYAKTGKANWVEDEAAAARATIAAMNTDARVGPPTPAGQTPAPTQPPPVAPSPAQAPPPASAAPPPPAARAPASPSPAAAPPAPAAPDDEEDQEEAEPDDWTEQAQQAAEETSQQQDTAPPRGAPPPPDFGITPDMLEMLVKMGAGTAVDLQLVLQAKLIKWRTGDDAPLVDHNSIGWKLPASIWEGQLRHWMANLRMDRIPPWLGAMLLTAVLGLGQYQARKPPVRKGLGVVHDVEWSEAGEERKAA